MRPDNHLLTSRTRNGAFVLFLLFGLAAAVLIGGCPPNDPGLVESPSGDPQGTAPTGGGSGGGPDGGGSGTTGGSETPSGGSTANQPPTLSTGVHAVTLQAAEAKWYRLPMISGESAIVNANVPDEATDVDLLVYAPRGMAPLSSSRNDAGMPDYVEFTATESGDYALEVVNESVSRQAGCTLNFQHIPSDSGVQDALNGIYTMVESGGQPMPPGSSASWVIANGRLVSLFGLISADLLGLPEDLRYWVDVAPGNATELHYMGVDIVVEVQHSEIVPLGNRNYLLSVSKRTTGTEAGSTPVVIEDTTQMLLALTADGCALCGSDVTWALTINGVPLGDIGLDVGPRLEKCPSSEVCDTTPTVEPPAAPSSPQPSNGASDTSVDVDLNWADASRASSYDVYFGAVSPPPLAGNTASSSWPLGTLNHDTTYFWKVVAKNSAGSTPGPVWPFTTVSQSPQSPGIPSNPSPPNGATGVSPGGFFLDWASTPRAASYDIHLGTSNPPPFIASDILSEWPVLLGTLDYDTTYYWQIVAKTAAGSTPGPVWSFTTVEEPLEPPGAPSAPSPPESAAGVSVDVDLDWADAERATSYDVYFGMTDPPPFAGNTASSAWPLGTLNYGTTYYWKVVAKNSAGSAPGPVWTFWTTDLIHIFPEFSDDVEFSLNGASILTWAWLHTVNLWDAHTFEPLLAFSPGHPIGDASISPDATRFVESDDASVRAYLRSAADGSVLQTFMHGSRVGAVAFSPDGTMVVTGAADGTAKLWNTSTGSMLQAFTGHSDDVSDVAFSPDGTRVLTGSHDFTAKTWNVSTGTVLQTFGGHADKVYSVCFSADGTKVLTGSRDSTAKLWNASTGALVRTFAGHSGAVFGVALSTDGTKVLTGSGDGTTKLWNTATGLPLRTYSTHGGGVGSVAFSPDGTQILIGSYGDHTARLYAVPSE